MCCSEVACTDEEAVRRYEDKPLLAVLLSISTSSTFHINLHHLSIPYLSPIYLQAISIPSPTPQTQAQSANPHKSTHLDHHDSQPPTPQAINAQRASPITLCLVLPEAPSKSPHPLIVPDPWQAFMIPDLQNSTRKFILGPLSPSHSKCPMLLLSTLGYYSRIKVWAILSGR